MLHETTLHPALQVFDLKLSTSLGNKLVLDHTIGIFLGLFVAFVEVVKGEGTFVWCSSHYNYLWSFHHLKKKGNHNHQSRKYLCSIIIFLILTSWRKSQRFKVGKYMTFISQLPGRVSKKGTQNTFRKSFVSSTHFLSNISAFSVLAVYSVHNVWLRGFTLSMIPRILSGVNSFWKASFKY